jgi:hypothetical protein
LFVFCFEIGLKLLILLSQPPDLCNHMVCSHAQLAVIF